MGNLTEMLATLGAFAMFSWIVFVIVDSFRRRQQLRVIGEFHSKLLDRVGTAGDLAALLGTESGARLLQLLGTERSSAGAHVRILRAAQAGIVLGALGLGLLAYGARHAAFMTRDAVNGLMLFTAIVLSVGVGLLVSAAVSWRLSRRLGLLPGTGGSNTEPPPAA